MINFEKYPIINYENYAFYVENPDVYPPNVRNILEKFDNDTHRYEIIDPKIQFLWSIKEHYDLPPLDALKHELGNIIKSNKMFEDRVINKFYCDAQHKFRVQFFMPGTAEERIVVVFGTYEKQMELRNAGVVLFCATLGSSSVLPALSVKALLAFYFKIGYEAHNTNANEFNPQKAVTAGVVHGGSTLMLEGFLGSIWNLIPSFK